MRRIDFPALSVTNKLSCVTWQESEDLIYTAAVAWNHTPDYRIQFYLVSKQTNSYTAFNWNCFVINSSSHNNFEHDPRQT